MEWNHATERNGMGRNKCGRSGRSAAAAAAPVNTKVRRGPRKWAPDVVAGPGMGPLNSDSVRLDDGSATATRFPARMDSDGHDLIVWGCTRTSRDVKFFGFLFSS